MATAKRFREGEDDETGCDFRRLPARSFPREAGSAQTKAPPSGLRGRPGRRDCRLRPGDEGLHVSIQDHEPHSRIFFRFAFMAVDITPSCSIRFDRGGTAKLPAGRRFAGSGPSGGFTAPHAVVFRIRRLRVLEKGWPQFCSGRALRRQRLELFCRCRQMQQICWEKP